jgi:hypothetical protein
MASHSVIARLTKSAEAISVGKIEIATGFALAMTEGGLVLGLQYEV